MNTLAQVSTPADYIGFLVVDAVHGLVTLLDVIPDCHWCCEVKRSDGILAYRTLAEITVIPQIALRPLAAPVVA